MGYGYWYEDVPDNFLEIRSLAPNIGFPFTLGHLGTNSIHFVSGVPGTRGKVLERRQTPINRQCVFAGLPMPVVGLVDLYIDVC